LLTANKQGVGLNEKTPLKDRPILGEKDTNIDCLDISNFKESPPSKGNYSLHLL